MAQKITFNLDKPFEMIDKEGYLEGQLLVSTPAIMGDIFSHSVIYMMAHNAYGAMGIIINKPIEQVHSAALFQQVGVEELSSIPNMEVYHGGPVEEQRGFILHDDSYYADDTIKHNNGFAVTASTKILHDIAAGIGPKQSLLAVGYASWGAGQIESEIQANSWISVPASSSIIFSEDNDLKWSMSAKSLGFDMGRMSTVAGHA